MTQITGPELSIVSDDEQPSRLPSIILGFTKSAHFEIYHPSNILFGPRILLYILYVHCMSCCILNLNAHHHSIAVDF